MSASVKTEEFVYDIFKLAVVETLFRYFEMLKLGATACVIIAVLVVWRHRRRLRLGEQRGTVGGGYYRGNIYSRPGD